MPVRAIRAIREYASTRANSSGSLEVAAGRKKEDFLKKPDA
jgi:hypothetical protein